MNNVATTTSAKEKSEEFETAPLLANYSARRTTQ
jgi:hypothetical protein